MFAKFDLHGNCHACKRAGVESREDRKGSGDSEAKLVWDDGNRVTATGHNMVAELNSSARQQKLKSQSRSTTGQGIRDQRHRITSQTGRDEWHCTWATHKDLLAHLSSASSCVP